MYVIFELGEIKIIIVTNALPSGLTLQYIYIITYPRLYSLMIGLWIHMKRLNQTSGITDGHKVGLFVKYW